MSRALLLYIHGSAELYGSDKVLLNVASAEAQSGLMQPVVVLHEDGPLRPTLQAAGVEVHIATVVKIQRALFSVAGLFGLPKVFLQALRDLDRITAGRRVGLVYSNTLAVLGGAVWARQRGLPHIWHVHEIIQNPAIVRFGLPRLAARLSDRIISNSRQTEAWMLSQAPRAASRSHVIFNGIGAMPVVQDADAAAFRQQVGAAPGDVVFTLAGRLNHWKGQDLLVEAAALLQAQGRLGRIRVAIVGDEFAGHQNVRTGLLQLVAKHGLEQRVQLVPFTNDIYPVWKGSDVAVVPSLQPEPFGMVAIEAMAAGLPVIAAAHGGLIDIVDDRNTGLLFEPRNVAALADALDQLSRDAALRQRMGESGRLRQRDQFSLHSQVQRTRALCQDVAAA